MHFVLASKSSVFAGRVARVQGPSLNRRLVSRPQRAFRVTPRAATNAEVSTVIVLKLKELIPDLKEVDITPDTEWNALNIDSLDFVEVLLELEKEYDVKLSEANFEELKTVGSAAELILTQKAAAASS